jgi:RND family efflux transporter MFP subunit
MKVYRTASLVTVSLVMASCGGSEPASTPKAVTVDNPVTETALTRVTLAEDAERRLAIRVDTVKLRRLAATRTLAGEIVPAPGMSQQLAAPVAGRIALPPDGVLPVSGRRVQAGQPVLTLVPIAADRDLLRSTEELQSAEVRLTRAQLEADRVAALWRDRLISAREREAAEAELALARSARDAASGRASLASGDPGVPAGVSPLVLRAPLNGVVRTLSVGDGQVVATGTPLLEVARLDVVWVRVPAYVGDLSRLDIAARAAVRLLGAATANAALVGVPVTAPPSADAVTASADLFYSVTNTRLALRPGERVQVEIPLRGVGGEVLSVPWAAVVFDHDGGSWVYEKLAERTYARRRISLGTVSGGWAEVLAGIGAGAVVVTDGAAELLGTEFGAGK